MLIGIDASRANRADKTGTEWYSYHLIRALIALDSRNSYVLYTDVPLTGGLAEVVRGNVRAKVLRWSFRAFWTLGRLSLEMLWHPPDVLFVPAHGLPLICPKRSIVTIHDIGYRHHPAAYGNAPIAHGRGRRVIGWLARLITGGRFSAAERDYLDWSTEQSLKRARRIIAISEHTKQDIVDQYQVDPERIAVVYNGFSAEAFFRAGAEASATAVLKRYHLTAPYLCYVGRIEAKKNIMTLLKAFAALKRDQAYEQYSLCLIGKPGFGFAEIEAYLRAEKLEDSVRLTGWMEEADMAEVLAQAAVFVFPSVYEGFGIPLLQAMAARVPVAAARAGAIPEIAGEAAVLFDPVDPAALVRAIKQVVGDETVRAALIEAGIAQAAGFSWERCAAETLNVLEDI